MTTETKYFTPFEAKKTLPLVKKIVKDILDTTKEMRLIAEDVDGNIESDSVKPKIQKMAGDVNGFMQELEEIGCLYKDWNFIIGLVDFPAVVDGREVYLCWRSDEEDVKFYHGIEEGYSSRKPIPDKYFNEN
jgi:hypothetical protein